MPDNKMTKVMNFFDLDAWKKGRELTRSIYLCTRHFPREEIFGLVSQMRRSSVSIIANIAEGFGRSHIKEKVNFYNQSYGSLTELQRHIFIATDLGFLTKNEQSELSILTQNTQLLLQGLLRSTRKRLAPPIS
jgi:four helix bundle protein